MIAAFFVGFFAKIIMGFDDAITQIPIMTGTVKTDNGRLLFAMGTLLALTFIIVLAMFFSHLISRIPYHRYLMACALLILAFLICKGCFTKRRIIRTKSIIKQVGLAKGGRAMIIGFVASMFTLMDDVVAYTPLLIQNTASKTYIVAGIYAGALLEILAIVYFAKALQKFKYKDQFAAAGLVVIAGLLVFGVI